MSTPIFDELKEHYFGQRELCVAPEYVLYDDGKTLLLLDVSPSLVLDEGQYIVCTEEEALASQLRRDYMRVYRESQYAEGGIVKGNSREVQRLLENFDNDCPVALVPKRKFKLFGRNQGTVGTV